MDKEIIAILRGVKPSEVVAIGQVLVDAGINKIEVPMNSPTPLKSIEALAEALGTQAIVGAGTVLEPQQVSDVANAGGQLIVSPNMQPEVIKATKALKLQSYPGVMTPTECFTALKYGVDGLKFFPSSVIGPAGFNAIKAVLPDNIRTYAVGGVGPENFAVWADAGITGFGIGSGLYKPGYSAAEVAERANACVIAYKNAWV